MRADEWVTLVYYAHVDCEPRTLRLNKLKAIHRKGVETIRPATVDEINSELDKEERTARELRELTDFQHRQDYQDAQMIRSALEWMSPQDHCLDRLTPQEWHELRKKICKEA